MSFFRSWAFIAGLAYFLIPTDLLPDFAVGVGWLEDIAILTALYLFWRNRQKEASQSSSRANRSTGYEHGYGQAGARGAGGGAHRQSTGSQSASGGNGGGSRPADPYKILGVERTASLEDVKHAYRIQANRYHPDKVSHLGEEFQTLANQKFQDIQWAYDEIRRARGKG